MRRVLAALCTVLVASCSWIIGIHDLPADGSSGDAGCASCACTTDSDCGAHMYCDIAPSSSACACVAGYALAGNACQWTGVIADPGFDLTPAGWTTGSATMIEPTFAVTQGMIDPGIAETEAMPCMGLVAGVSQSIVMPRLSRAEPLVAEVSYAGNGPLGFPTPVAIEIASLWYPTALSVFDASFQTTRVCLGEAQYAPESSSGSGATATTAMLANCSSGLGNFDGEYDHYDIVLPNAGECPVPGTVTNGDAEGSDGWSFSTSYNNGSTDGTSAGYAAGVGDSGSRAVHLHLAERCDDADATVPMSVPLRDGTGSPSLSVWHQKPTSAGTLGISVGGLPLLLTAPADSIDHYCLPTGLHGGVSSLQAAFYTNGTSCGSATTADAYVDSVTVANDPKCGSDPGIADPSFESGYSMIGSTSTTSDTVAIVTGDGNAYEGSGYLRLSIDGNCNYANYTTTAIVPASPPGTGPAVSFHYQFPAGGTANASITASSVKPLTLGRTSTWQPAIACLDPTAPVGWPAQFYIELDTTAGTCTTGTTTIANIDALQVTTDPACAP
ncbi:MAG TPA: hypothetical protein VMJ10_35340 [Kofleriaceae bacterium]|nr:hypothetical protein [Kofleriaceae bacterium]